MSIIGNHDDIGQRFYHIKVVVADDHAIVREGISVLLKEHFTVIGMAADGLEAVMMTERLRPTVLVVDLTMPKLTGLEVVKQIQERVPTTKTIVLSMNDDETQIARAIKNGASGYVFKQMGGSELVKAIHEVMRGRRYLTPLIDAERIESYLRHSDPIPTDPYDMLTPREREILSLVVQGYTSQQIAGFLSISSRTVEVHRAHLLAKFNVNNVVELIHIALKRADNK
jgi:DNA-binding NarL/FixJ family response regulator